MRNQKQALWDEALFRLSERYAENMPVEILNRFLSERAEWREADAIIHFDIMRRILRKAQELGEYAYSRYAVGSSFVAYLMGATSVNPLPPHYYCPKCQRVEFHYDVSCGWDLPEKQCQCGTAYIRDGHNIPYEVLRSAVRFRTVANLCVSERMYPIALELIRQYFPGQKIVFFPTKDEDEPQPLIVLDKGNSDYVDGEYISLRENRMKLVDRPCITILKDKTLDSLRDYSASAEIFSPNILEDFIHGDKAEIPGFNGEIAESLFQLAPPNTFHDLLQIYGIAHSDGLWEAATKMLVLNGVPIADVIAFRDDVFAHIQRKVRRAGLQGSGFAHDVMEKARKGIYYARKQRVSSDVELRALEMDEWFINCLGKTKYLPSKAQGVECLKLALLLMQKRKNVSGNAF